MGGEDREQGAQSQIAQIVLAREVGGRHADQRPGEGAREPSVGAAREDRGECEQCGGHEGEQRVGFRREAERQNMPLRPIIGAAYRDYAAMVDSRVRELSQVRPWRE